MEQNLVTVLVTIRGLAYPVSAINIGASPQAIEESGKAILAILNSGAEQKTLRCALKAFCDTSKVEHSSISNCNFDINQMN